MTVLGTIARETMQAECNLFCAGRCQQMYRWGRRDE